jgi:hypothetical protein
MRKELEEEKGRTENSTLLVDVNMREEKDTSWLARKVDSLKMVAVRNR